jgi:hypothetical protein
MRVHGLLEVEPAQPGSAPLCGSGAGECIAAGGISVAADMRAALLMAAVCRGTSLRLMIAFGQSGIAMPRLGFMPCGDAIGRRMP